MIRSYLFIFLLFSFCNKRSLSNQNTNKKHNYFFSVNGDDKNDGSLEHPFKTIEHFNSINLIPGDSIFFKAGDTFNGNAILNSTKSGVNKKSVVITSYGNGYAIINAENGTAFSIYNLS